MEVAAESLVQSVRIDFCRVLIDIYAPPGSLSVAPVAECEQASSLRFLVFVRFAPNASVTCGVPRKSL